MRCGVRREGGEEGSFEQRQKEILRARGLCGVHGNSRSVSTERERLRVPDGSFGKGRS